MIPQATLDHGDQAQRMTAAVADLAAGRPIVISGARTGAFVLAAAERTTPAIVNLMASHARALVGLVLSRKRARALGLKLQPRNGSTAPLYTNSIKAAEATSTGISTHDRARTLRATGLRRA